MTYKGPIYDDITSSSVRFIRSQTCHTSVYVLGYNEQHILYVSNIDKTMIFHCVVLYLHFLFQFLHHEKFFLALNADDLRSINLEIIQFTINNIRYVETKQSARNHSIKASVWCFVKLLVVS